jgi:hypothetical protein
MGWGAFGGNTGMLRLEGRSENDMEFWLIVIDAYIILLGVESFCVNPVLLLPGYLS